MFLDDTGKYHLQVFNIIANNFLLCSQKVGRAKNHQKRNDPFTKFHNIAFRADDQILGNMRVLRLTEDKEKSFSLFYTRFMAPN